MYAVTGATGQLGGRVARRLADQRHDLRLVVRDSARAPHLEGVDVEEATYDDFDAMRAALVGVDSLFLVSATEVANRVEQHTTAVDAAAAAGVRRIVYLSFLAAAPAATFTFARDHWATEEHIKGVGAAYTFLRPSLYLDLAPSWASADDHTIRGPAGSGRVAWVSRDDIADVAVSVLTGGRHDGQTYDVTGRESLSLAETAVALSEASGQDVSYVEETLDEARLSRQPSGAEPWAIEGWVTSYAAIGTGEMDAVADTVGNLAEHPPVTLAEYLAAYPEAVDHLRS